MVAYEAWDDKMTHKGRKDRGPGMIDVLGNTLTFRVGVDELDPFLVSGDTVLIWADTKLKKVTDKWGPPMEIETGVPENGPPAHAHRLSTHIAYTIPKNWREIFPQFFQRRPLKPVSLQDRAPFSPH